MTSERERCIHPLESLYDRLLTSRVEAFNAEIETLAKEFAEIQRAVGADPEKIIWPRLDIESFGLRNSTKEKYNEHSENP
jgi:hypothetical protein